MRLSIMLDRLVSLGQDIARETHPLYKQNLIRDAEEIKNEITEKWEEN